MIAKLITVHSYTVQNAIVQYLFIDATLITPAMYKDNEISVVFYSRLIYCNKVLQ